VIAESGCADVRKSCSLAEGSDWALREPGRDRKARAKRKNRIRAQMRFMSGAGSIHRKYIESGSQSPVVREADCLAHVASEACLAHVASEACLARVASEACLAHVALAVDNSSCFFAR
jgi:hypothetical protein